MEFHVGLFFLLIVGATYAASFCWVFLTSFLHWQHTSLSPDGKLLVVVGDNPEGALIDACTGKVSRVTFGFIQDDNWG